jgi:hypothetical protein
MNSPTRSVSILREHSEQLQKLSTDLSEDLSQLRRALSEQEGACDTEELGLVVGLAESNSSLLARLTFFISGFTTAESEAREARVSLSEH